MRGFCILGHAQGKALAYAGTAAVLLAAEVAVCWLASGGGQ